MIKAISTKTLGKTPITAVVLSLGSNHHAKKTLAIACQALESFGAVYRLGRCHSPDHSGRSVVWYHNLAVQIRLSEAVSLPSFLPHLKAIERLCGRRQHSPRVAMDIDVLAVQTDNHWYLLLERCPLKAYERQCLTPFLGEQ